MYEQVCVFIISVHVCKVIYHYTCCKLELQFYSTFSVICVHVFECVSFAVVFTEAVVKFAGSLKLSLEACLLMPFHGVL